MRMASGTRWGRQPFQQAHKHSHALSRNSEGCRRLYDQRDESGEGADHRDEATTGADHRDDAVACEVANEEETSDATAMKPTVTAVARNLRMRYTLLDRNWSLRSGLDSGVLEMVRRCPALIVKSHV